MCRYNSKYPFKFEGLYLLQPSEFRKSRSNIKTTPLYQINNNKKKSFISRLKNNMFIKPSDIMKEDVIRFDNL